MNISHKILIDVEKEDKTIGYFFRSEDGKKIEAVLAGKQIAPVPKRERSLKIYKLLKENCDLIFCTTQTLNDFPFYPVPIFSIFAFDNQGNCFGTIGGIGDMAGDDYSVGYVNSDGMYGKVLNSLKEFLELVTFYPYWRDIIKYEQMGIPYDINAMERKQTENSSEYFACQREIAEILNISKNPKSIELLL
ncbi:hypothetical protein [Biomaibacter acetigenes]|uniref:hypothetical protein n=1 Tax=Biomaibacter acetigenes TaxID=2316383 RepID=UPI001CA3ADC9|nr:hypothetical protein [Biomaibacter acetigenes]